MPEENSFPKMLVELIDIVKEMQKNETRILDLFETQQIKIKMMDLKIKELEQTIKDK